jgi:hypothetical protein
VSDRPLLPTQRPSFWRDLLGYLREHKKVWLLPLVLVLLLVGVIVSLGSSPLAPLLYTLF